MRTPRKLLRRSLSAVVLATVAISLIAAPAFAARSGGGGGKPKPITTTGSISVVMVTDVNHDGLPNHGDQMTYDVSKVGVTNPFITTTCVQNGVNVLTTYAGYYSGYLWPGAQTITLNTELWTAGSATCTAVVSNTSIKLVISVGG
jgi:hypothetical protein